MNKIAKTESDCFKVQRVVQEINFWDSTTLAPPIKYNMDCSKIHVMMSMRSLRDVGGILEVVRLWKTESGNGVFCDIFG